ncbi:MAG: TIGR03943 family putative permease subunit [Actinomycetota bacterium]
MMRYAQGLVLTLFGIVATRVAISDQHLNYVKPSIQPYLIISGLLVTGLGAVVMWRSVIPQQKSHKSHSRAERGPGGSPEMPAAEVSTGRHRDDDGGHNHHSGPHAGWLLLLPVLTLFTVAPTALGADAASRDSGVINQSTGRQARALPSAPTDGSALTLSVLDLSIRTAEPGVGGLEGKTVRIDGFASPGGSDTWYVTRMMLACCAADGIAVKVEARAVAAPPPDTWIEVVGVVERPASPDGETPPAIRITEIRPISKPRNPYISFS